MSTARRDAGCASAVGHLDAPWAVLRGWTADVPSMIVGGAIASGVDRASARQRTGRHDHAVPATEA